jgi:hypothetical protein
MTEETKVEETEPEEPKAEETKAEETESEEPKAEGPKAEDEPGADEETSQEVAEDLRKFPSSESMGAFEVGVVSQPPAVPDTVYVPAAFAKDGVTALKAAGVQYTRVDHFGRAAILHSDRVNSAALSARPTYTDRQVVDGDLNFVPVVGSGANNPPR